MGDLIGFLVVIAIIVISLIAQKKQKSKKRGASSSTSSNLFDEIKKFKERVEKMGQSTQAPPQARFIKRPEETPPPAKPVSTFQAKQAEPLRQPQAKRVHIPDESATQPQVRRIHIPVEEVVSQPETFKQAGSFMKDIEEEVERFERATVDEIEDELVTPEEYKIKLDIEPEATIPDVRKIPEYKELPKASGILEKQIAYPKMRGYARSKPVKSLANSVQKLSMQNWKKIVAFSEIYQKPHALRSVDELPLAYRV